MEHRDGQRLCKKGLHWYTPGRGCRECRRLYQKESYRKNREVWLARNSKWNKENREKCNQHQKNYAAKHPEKICQKAANRRALKREAIPPLSRQHLRSMRRCYKLAEHLRSVGINVHVDHRIPMVVGGEHAPWNLQILPATDNCSKRDILIPSELRAVMDLRIRWMGCNSF